MPKDRDDNFTAILNALKQLHATYPQLRFGQLILNAVQDINVDLYYIRDENLLHDLTIYQKKG